MLILTETDVEEGAVLTEKLRTARRSASASRSRATRTCRSRSRSASPAAPGSSSAIETLVRDADAAMYSAKSLGRNQTYIFAEPDEDARVPRAPISDAGRARAMEIGRQARDAATGRARPRSSRRSPTTAASRRRSSPSIVVEMARQLELPEAEIDRIRVAALLHDVGKVAVPEEILDKPAALTSGRVAVGRPAPAHRPGHPRAGGRAQATRCRSSSTTTSASPATATRTACAPTRSRSARGSSPSPTPTTR